MMWTFFLQRKQHDTFITVTQQDALEERRGRPIGSFRPFSNAQTLAFNSQDPVVAFITSLNNRKSPFYVALFIMAVYLFTFQRIFRSGFAPNVVQKFFKRSKSKFNAAFSVICVCLGVRIITPVFSLMIGLVFGRLSLVSAFSVGNTKFLASTRFGVARGQMIARNTGNCSANAFTEPHRSAFNVARKAQDGQVLKNKIGKVMKTGASWQWSKFDGIFGVGHWFSSLESVMRSFRASLRATSPIIAPIGGGY